VCVCVCVCLQVFELMRISDERKGVIMTCMQMTHTHICTHTHMHMQGTLPLSIWHTHTHTHTHAACVCGRALHRCASVWVASGDTAALPAVLRDIPSLTCESQRHVESFLFLAVTREVDATAWRGDRDLTCFIFYFTESGFSKRFIRGGVLRTWN